MKNFGLEFWLEKPFEIPVLFCDLSQLPILELLFCVGNLKPKLMLKIFRLNKVPERRRAGFGGVMAFDNNCIAKRSEYCGFI